MTQKEKFNRAAWLALRHIKTSVGSQSNTTRYRVTFPEVVDMNGSSVPAYDVIEVLEKFNEWKILRIKDAGETFSAQRYDITRKFNDFDAEVLQPKFDNVYGLYKNAIEQEIGNAQLYDMLQELVLQWRTPSFDTWSVVSGRKPVGKPIPARKESKEGADESNQSIADKPYVITEGSRGFLKFHKQGEKIAVGAKSSRHFRYLQSLCEPHFGVQKNVQAVFEAIRLPKDKNDSRLAEFNPQRSTRMVELIEFAKKELQKNAKLRGKIRYCIDPQKRNFWLELEG